MTFLRSDTFEYVYCRFGVKIRVILKSMSDHSM